MVSQSIIDQMWYGSTPSKYHIDIMAIAKPMVGLSSSVAYVPLVSPARLSRGKSGWRDYGHTSK